ncbi:two-component system sensor histidine kinase DesK [Nonomuraea thailandensis]|uniref:Two-component system sensor histidine kinase DesK n=1 Tax=Nonomuraea thailandensis TaxID=1188745 RepID=A0A9X2GIE9_9ACTN|nr:histidine kinase [Nonomuraea thailandensis]MCP2359042.1 two-component system sensor histidine kinase DesK [Nonomuraea thailandensis]
MALGPAGSAHLGALNPVRLVLVFIGVTGLLRVSFYFVVQEFDLLTVVCVAVVAALQVPISLPGRRRLSAVLFPVQAVVNYLPLLADPASWEVGGSGFVAASALLVVSGPPAWVILGLIAAVEGAVALAHDRLPYMVYYAIIAPINVGLMLYGVSSLAVLLHQVRRERSELAARAGAVERLRLWGRIHDLVVRNVAAVEQLTRQAREAGGRGDAAAARTAVGAAVALARETLERVRALPPADEAIPVPPREDDKRILRLATPILVVAHVLFIGQAVFYFAGDAERGPGFTHAAYLVLFPVTFALQLWHLAALRSSPRPGTLAWTLAAHALAIYAPLALGEGSGLLASGFFAGVLLLYLPWRVAWPLSVAMGGVAAVEEALSLGPIAGVYPFFSVLSTAVAVYGLTRLVDLVGELGRTRAELVEVAALRERLKVGRDVHDLLGRGLTTIVLHAELALRLLGQDSGRAAEQAAGTDPDRVVDPGSGRVSGRAVDAEAGRVDAQLERLAEAARAALSDNVGLGASGRALSLAAEIDSAKAALESAGVAVLTAVTPVTGTAAPRSGTAASTQVPGRAAPVTGLVPTVAVGVGGIGALVIGLPVAVTERPSPAAWTAETMATPPAPTAVHPDATDATDAPDELMEGPAGPVLAVVLREAVTNVLRHGTPTECVIELTVQDGHVRLRVTNDGAARVQEPEPGSGLRNLRARLAAIGGDLTTTRTGDRFELLARTPVDHEDLTTTR